MGDWLAFWLRGGYACWRMGRCVRLMCHVNASWRGYRRDDVCVCATCGCTAPVDTGAVCPFSGKRSSIARRRAAGMAGAFPVRQHLASFFVVPGEHTAAVGRCDARGCFCVRGLWAEVLRY